MEADVAVIGGGAIGLACAVELAGMGAGEVVVLEALASVGQASSSRANGGFRAQFTAATNVAFSAFSIERFESLERRTGLLSMKQNGYLLITGTEDGERSLIAARDLQVSMGVTTELLTTAQVEALAPFVRSEGLRAATFHPRDGFLDPAGLVAALEAEARSAGVKLMTGARVEEILREGGDSTLRHARGEVRVGIVVNAAGADAGRVAALAGSSVPVDPVRRNLALFLDPAANAGAPMCVDLDTGVLVRPEGSSGWIAAYSDPLDPPGRDISLDPRFLEQLAERAPHRFPFLTDLPVDPARCWAGLYPETPDHHAIVGFDPAVPGLVHCAGFGGHGIMHAPAAGRAVAELVTTGSCETFDLRPLRPSRFAEGDLVAETSVF